MARAGYDPEESIRFWERFAASHGNESEGISLLRTHPVDSKRIADLKALMPEAQAEFHKAKSGGSATGSPGASGSTVISK
jgi:predicted Zn-dependent protease